MILFVFGLNNKWILFTTLYYYYIFKMGMLSWYDNDIYAEQSLFVSFLLED